MRRRRPSYRAERSRSQRDGGAGLALFRMQEREKAKRDRFKPYNLPKTIAKAITDPFKPRRPRKPRRK
jgi:hypothetical protein